MSETGELGAKDVILGAAGDGEGVGIGVGIGEGVGVKVGVGLGVGVRVGEEVGVGDGMGEGDGEGVGVGVGSVVLIALLNSGREDCVSAGLITLTKHTVISTKLPIPLQLHFSFILSIVLSCQLLTLTASTIQYQL